MSNPIEDVMNGLADAMDRETPSEIIYKDFMKADKDSSAYDIFSTYDMAVGEHVMIICKIIKQKYGIKRMDDELYRFIQIFPSMIHRLGDEIQKNEGPVCCVDKAWSRSMKHFNDLIDLNISREKSNG